jgi:hypothetical protein
MFCTEFSSEFHSALRGSLGRIEDLLALKMVPVCAHFLNLQEFQIVKLLKMHGKF